MLTFEKIRELYWNEKGSQKLQDIPENFFVDAAEYLRGDDETIKTAINELIESRQSKILKMAVMSLKSPVAKHHNLTKDEEKLFSIVLNSLKEFRSNILEGKVTEETADDDKNTYRTTEPEEKDAQIKAGDGVKEGFCMIKENLPSFIGNDMKTYHLRKGDKVYLPKELMSLLVKTGACERLN